MHGLKWTTNKPSFSDIIQHTFFFLIAVWKDLYTVYTSALLPIASKFGPQEVNRCNQLCGLFHWAPDWFLLSRNAMIFVAAIWLLRRMKACIDKLRPNTSQANYFERILEDNKPINAKIEVRKLNSKNLSLFTDPLLSLKSPPSAGDKNLKKAGN